MVKPKILIEIRKHMITAIMAAFGFVIALSWNDAIRSVVNELLKDLNIIGTTYYYKIIAAVIVTLVCVIGITIVARIHSKRN